MEELIVMAINLGIPFLFILTALLIGGILEKKHFASIDAREKEFRVPVLNHKAYPDEVPVEKAWLVTGSVVISHDYFKRILAGLRNIFGGEVKSYVSLLDRGRREAVLRMKESCPDADLIVNLRIETSSISKGGKNALGTVEVLAYGTAIRYLNDGG